MANTIKLKRGTSAPSTSDISSGEVAIDTSAKKFYINDSGTVKEIGGGTTVGGATGVDFNDNVKVRCGTGNDLEIYHDGTDTKLENAVGKFILKQSNTENFEIKTNTNQGVWLDPSGWFLPSVNNTIYLGHSNYRWAYVYGAAGNFSGTVTANAFSGDGSNLTGVSAAVGSDAQYNTVGGTDAGSSFSGTSAEKNTLYGYHAGAAMSTGDENTIVGYKAGEDITTGGTNTIVGNYSGERLTTHGNNTFFGHMSGSENTGESNIAVGSYALKDSGSGTNNIALGNYSLNYNTNGTFNIGVGQGAVEGVYGQNKNYNIGIGLYALQKSKADYNIGIGRSAGANGQNTGSYNISIGNYSGYALTSGQENTLLGEYAGNSLTTGSNNLVLGHEAEPSAATVSNEVTLGNASITKFRIPGLNFTLKDSTATEDYVLTVDANGEAGWEAASGGGGGGGVTSDSDGNTVGGTDAGDNFTSGQGQYNTCFGYEAGTDLNTGDNNVFIGYKAGANATSSSNAVAIGYEALHNMGASRNYQTAVGYQALRNNGHGQECTAVGYQALYSNSIGDDQCAFGVYALKNSDKHSNSAFGYKSLMDNTSGEANSAFGCLALENNTGDYNCGFGYKAGDNIDGGSNNLCLGYNAQPTAASTNNEITLGNASITKLRIPGLNNFEISDGGVFSGVTSTANATPGVRKITTSTSAPSGGSDGDIWVKYTN